MKLLLTPIYEMVSFGSNAKYDICAYYTSH